jgi:peptide chain release factor
MFSVPAALHEKPLPPRQVIEESEITESFLKGTGPGGQKINKTSSAVQLKHIPTGIVVKCQGTRSREQNRKDARKLLGEKLEEMEKGDQSRTAIKAERARVKKASSSKKSRRKYKLLAEGKVESVIATSESGSEGGVDNGCGVVEHDAQVTDKGG